MNLKKSIFLKRIQELRKISKEKLRKERARLYGQMHDAFSEQRAISAFSVKSKLPKKQRRHSLNKNTTGQQQQVKYIQQLVLTADGGGDANDKRNHTEHNEVAIFCKPAIVPEDDETEQSLVNSNSEDELVMAETRKDIKDEPVINPSILKLKEDIFQLKFKSKAKHDDGMFVSNRGSICVHNSRYGMIGRISKTLGFKLVRETKLWNILWTDSFPSVEMYKNMKRFQQINHFPGMMEICRKDLLSRNLNRMLKLFPRDYKIFPRTWIFPADFGDAMKYANSHVRSKYQHFIIKPDSGAQGRGIYLTNDLKQVNPSERMICQTYISKPLLIDGYKFDLRVYALITSVDPLRIFVYNEGLARFATSKYVEPTAINCGDLFMHLTNYSVNKRSSQYDVCDDDECGSKRTFGAVNNWMRRRGYDVDEFWRKIDDIIIKTVLSAWPMLRHNYHACFPSHDKIQGCFEILGFDVLVDYKLKPYILEVNHSPSFHTNELVDKQVKKALIKDTLSLVSSALADKRQIMREDRKRVKARLLQLRHSKDNHEQTLGKSSKLSNLTTHTIAPPVKNGCKLSPLGQQIAWEESHLGDFRRIMPPQDSIKLNYYCQFYALQNQASIYAETANSKKREENAKKLRLQLEEKRKQIELSKSNPIRAKFEERRRKRMTMPRAVLEKHRVHRTRVQAHWIPGFISEAEERLRRTWMQMRTDLLKNMKVVQAVYLFLYNAGGLTNSDILNYPELYRSLENGSDIMSTAT